MSGSIRYLDDFMRFLKNADEIAAFRGVLTHMADDIDSAVKAADNSALDDLIRRGAESGDAQVARVFGNDAFQATLRRTRSRHLFDNEFTTAAAGTGKIDLQALIAKHGLDENDEIVKVAREYLDAHPARRAVSLEDEVRAMREQLAEQSRRTDQLNSLNWTGRFNRMVHNVADRAGPFKGVVLVGGKGLLYSTAVIGLGGTALTVAGVSHLATGGESTRALTRLADDTATGLYHTLKDSYPEFAELLKEKSPEITRFMFTAATLDTQMITASLRELNSRHNTGVSDDDLSALAHVIEGDIVMGAFRKVTGVEVQGADVERIMRGAMNEPDKKAYIAREFARLSGRAESEFAAALASPEMFDITGMTPEQIAERFGQTNEISTGGDTSMNTARSALERGQDALRRRTEQAREFTQRSIDQAAEAVRIGRLSGEGLSSEFNRVVDEKKLSWFSSPTMFMIKLMDFIGFDFFGLNDMLKKQVLIDNVKTQFGDRFGVLNRGGANLDLDHAPAAPAS